MFIVILSPILGLMHVYVWKRLIKDTTRSRRIRWVLTSVLTALAALLIAALTLPRVVGVSSSGWFAWPGYRWFALVAYLFSREGSFFVAGNQEYFGGDPNSWLRKLERLGVQPLRNENTVIRRGTAAFDLAGVNDVAGASRSDPPDFDRALSGRDSSRPTVLLAHQPVQVAQAAARGVDLQLSGHTTEARCGPSTTPSARSNRRSPDYPQWTIRSSTFREVQVSGVRRCGSARRRTSA